MTEPLAERLRPRSLDDYIGQQHLVGEGAVLRKMIDAGRISSFILWGPPGVGKTEIAMKAIPLLFHCVLKKIVSRYKATDICREEIYRSLMHNDLIVIDDFGIEGMFNDYGNPHIVFSEVVDNIECKGGLLIATTNLTLDEIHIKYGLRTIDRLRGNTKLVVFTEESMRGMYEKVY